MTPESMAEELLEEREALGSKWDFLLKDFEEKRTWRVNCTVTLKEAYDKFRLGILQIIGDEAEILRDSDRAPLLLTFDQLESKYRMNAYLGLFG